MLPSIIVARSGCYAARILDSVGSRVRAIRQARKFTQRELADLAGVYHTTISELERSVTVPSIKTLEKIATALGISVAELLQART